MQKRLAGDDNRSWIAGHSTDASGAGESEVLAQRRSGGDRKVDDAGGRAFKVSLTSLSGVRMSKGLLRMMPNADSEISYPDFRVSPSSEKNSYDSYITPRGANGR